MKLCGFGCGKEAKFIFKNGKACCSKHWRQCPEILESRKGKKRKPMSLDTKEKIRYTKIGDLNPMRKESSKKKSSKSHLGKIPWNKDKKTGPQSEETIRKRSEAMKISCKGKVPSRKAIEASIEVNRKRLLNGGAEYLNSFPKNGYKSHKDWMLNGGAVYILSFSKNPSKEEVKLRELVQSACPYPIHNYPIYKEKGKKSYNVDNACPKLDLIIEFDGYWHFCDQEHIDYHNKRQKEIEEEGWKFLRYNIFHPFPTLEQLKQDIQKIVNNY